MQIVTTSSQRSDMRESIMHAAEDVVRESGSAHLTIDAVCARAGISKGGFLYHFPTKEALLQAMIMRLCHAVNDSSRARQQADETPGQRLKSHIRAMDELLLDRQRRGFFAALLAAAAHDHQLLAPIREERSQFVAEFTALGFSKSLVLMVLLTLEGLFLTELLDLQPAHRRDHREIVDRLLDVVDAEAEKLAAPAPAGRTRKRK